ncbi:hypothetical protein F0562_014410 [Nyssa sinensis]|uniref:Uncharacterized protein n=1 Tax=Nyssa sinensis TaxID=561372 RepID=A0A5J4ZQK5_9ASTE|nr:hypothetical protein F0562_014410 [Nyssa sinensis]
MAFTTDGAKAKHKRNKEMYAALISGNERKVIELCRRIAEGPLHILTIHNASVLHMATFNKQKDLVLNLLKELPQNHSHKLMHQNEVGNTLLHETATSKKMVPVAGELLRKAPELLGIRNFNGETAIFHAARYGKNDVFRFLDHQINYKVLESEGREADRKLFYQRDDNTTILHISTLSEHFDLALLIATKYEYLVNERDGDGLPPEDATAIEEDKIHETALQLAPNLSPSVGAFFLAVVTGGMLVLVAWGFSLFVICFGSV